VVFEDADLDSAVEGVVDAIWFNQGEVCCAGSRLLVQEGVAEALHDRLRRRMETLRVGDPTDKGVDVGAVVDRVQLARIGALVEQGVAEGARLWQPATPCPKQGCFFPPTLFTDVHPAATIAQEEIFGPVLVSMTFRTPEEAIRLANDTRYGLAASVWTQDLDTALDAAANIRAGTVWINCTNRFDAAAGFGGMRESGFGREGGREGLWEYVHEPRPAPPASAPPAPRAAPVAEAAVDRSAKLYVGGRHKRPDSGYARAVLAPDGTRIEDVGAGNRKDVRDAVEAARRAQPAWGARSGHERAQVLYYLAENLAPRAAELATRIVRMTGAAPEAARREVELSLERIFTWAAWADKFDGHVHDTASRHFTFALHEPVGVMGVACPDEAPLLAFVSAALAAVALGNAVVAVPSPPHPLAVTDLVQVLDTSDLPGGVLNVVTGERATLGAVLAAHDGVEALWHFGPREETAEAERLSAGNLKRTWTDGARDWADPAQGAGREFLRHAVQVKNVWTPFGA
jgi:aldehyde dehydrogenase (NAD+)